MLRLVTHRRDVGEIGCRAQIVEVRSMSLARDRDIEEEDVLFDEDDATYAASNSSRSHSKVGTDSSTTAANSDEERAAGGFAADFAKGRR